MFVCVCVCVCVCVGGGVGGGWGHAHTVCCLKPLLLLLAYNKKKKKKKKHLYFSWEQVGGFMTSYLLLELMASTSIFHTRFFSSHLLNLYQSLG